MIMTVVVGGEQLAKGITQGQVRAPDSNTDQTLGSKKLKRSLTVKSEM